MSLLVVAAHYDPTGSLADHFRGSLRAYAELADRVVVVSTSGLAESEHGRVPAGVELLTRRNFGYDFYSYKWGLDYVQDYPDYDQVLIVNDSFVGPTVPLIDITASDQAMASDLMGMTLSHNHGDHVQSFFMLANRYVTRSRAFRSFWDDMTPVSDRTEVIQRYEVGFSRAVTAAGFGLGSYFVPTEEEERLAALRYQWHGDHRYDRKYTHKTIAEMGKINLAARPWNPGLAYADRILLGARLPLLKLDALRFDPYALGADYLLERCVENIEREFTSLPAYIANTRQFYPTRPGERNKTVTHESLAKQGVGYCLDEAFARQAKECTA